MILSLLSQFGDKELLLINSLLGFLRAHVLIPKRLVSGRWHSLSGEGKHVRV